jgi:hypothetical protein
MDGALVLAAVCCIPLISGVDAENHKYMVLE